MEVERLQPDLCHGTLKHEIHVGFDMIIADGQVILKTINEIPKLCSQRLGMG